MHNTGFVYLVFFYPFVEGWREISHGDWIGILPIVIGILMWLAVILVIGMVATGIYDAIDKSGPTIAERGTVTETRYVPAHTTMVYNAATKTSTPIFHPPRWYATFAVKGTAEELGISETLHEKLQSGDQMNLLTTTGKLSKVTRIVGFAS